MKAQKAQSIKENLDKLDFIKIKNLYFWKMLLREWKDKPHSLVLEIIFAQHVFDETLESEYIKNSQISIIRQPNKKWAKELNRSKEDEWK